MMVVTVVVKVQRNGASSGFTGGGGGCVEPGERGVAGKTVLNEAQE